MACFTKIQQRNGTNGKFKQGKSEGFDRCDRPRNHTQIRVKSSIFQPMWSWNLMDDPEKQRAPLLYSIKLCASFYSHQWIQIEATVHKCSVRVKIGDFLFCVTLKFDGWPLKTIGRLFYTASNFVHHFKATGEFKLELQSRNAQFGSKSTIFFSLVTLKFDGWPWKTMRHLS